MLIPVLVCSLLITTEFASCVDDNEDQLSQNEETLEQDQEQDRLETEWFEIENQLFKKDLPYQDPEETLRLLKQSHEHKSEAQSASEWRRSGKLIHLSEHNQSKCKEDYLKEINKMVEDQYKNYTRIIRYLRFCRAKQLEYCRNNFNEMVLNSVKALTNDDRIDVEMLIDFIIRGIDLQSIQALSQIPTEYSYSGVLNYLEIKNGPLNALDFEQYDEIYEKLYIHTIEMLCGRLEQKFEGAIFTLEEARPILNNHYVMEWMARVRICKDITKSYFRQATFSELLKKSNPPSKKISAKN